MSLRVLTLIDTLVAAGAERMAVNIANATAEKGVESHLCATHQGGPLAQFFNYPQRFFVANKAGWWDVFAFLKILFYVYRHRIVVIHAHSSSVYWACLLRLGMPWLRIIWHDHFGFSEYLERRTAWALKMCRPLVSHVFVVNRQLWRYAVRELKYSEKKVTLLLNFPELKHGSLEEALPGMNHSPRFVCLANIRPQKDHHTLLDAFERVLKVYPQAQLYFVGGDYGDEYLAGVQAHIKRIDSENKHVHLLGSRNDVSAILDSCHAGVLSSISEGLPVALLEYGLSGLPVVCTRVGECPEVLQEGRLGWLVEARDSVGLAEMMVTVVSEDASVFERANKYHEEVKKKYSKESAVATILKAYGVSCC
ncbi:MAG: glycosyltransferase [Marinilabiliaceae bacterium]|nr:glycosyltransferase [Marinilabiliaceae bacterium]